jgi:hypothetical protein
MSVDSIAAQISQIAQPFVGQTQPDRDILIVGGLGITGYDFIEFLEEVESAFDVCLPMISPKRGEPGSSRDVSINDLAAIIVEVRDTREGASQ